MNVILFSSLFGEVTKFLPIMIIRFVSAFSDRCGPYEVSSSDLQRVGIKCMKTTGKMPVQRFVIVASASVTVFKKTEVK